MSRKGRLITGRSSQLLGFVTVSGRWSRSVIRGPLRDLELRMSLKLYVSSFFKRESKDDSL